MITYLAAGLLGLIFVTLAKANSLKKDFAVANQTFIWRKFWDGEIIGIAMSLVFIILMAITVKEWIGIKPQFENYVTIIFAMGGAIGSWAFQLFLGKSKKYIRTVIDIKTNIVDNEIGKTGTITELKQAAADTGKDITKPAP